LSELIGFAAGDSGPQPPFGDWTWPDDFTSADKDLFWKTVKSTDTPTDEEAVVYNRVSEHNNASYYSGGKGGIGLDVESLQRERAWYAQTIANYKNLEPIKLEDLDDQ
jgi:hypothetical protein